nr:TPA_asm: ORF1b [Candastroli virus 2]
MTLWYRSLYDVYAVLVEHVSSRVKRLDELCTELNNSPGWPWKKKYKDKRATLEDPTVDIWDTYEATEIAWMGFPKFEILAASKADQKTRLITAAPADLTFLVLRLVEDQDDQIKEIDNIPIMVGKTKFHCGWDRVMRRLGSCVDEVDARQWDGSVRPYELEGLVWLRFNLLAENDRTEANLARLRWAYKQLIYAPVRLTDGSWYSVAGGMKSGWPSTSIDNSLVNWVRNCYAWRRVTGDQIAMDPMSLLIYGDDILSRPRGERYWQAYREAGTILPDNRVKLNIPITEASFLSSKVVRKGTIFVPVPDGTKLVFSAAWWDQRPKREMRYTKAKSLWLEGYFTEQEPLLRKFYELTASSLGYKPVRREWARMMYFGLEVGGPK